MSNPLEGIEPVEEPEHAPQHAAPSDPPPVEEPTPAPSHEPAEHRIFGPDEEPEEPDGETEGGEE
jgi:hypothetical protein